MSSATAQIGLRIFLQDSASAGLGALGISLGSLGFMSSRLSTAWAALGPGMKSLTILTGVAGIAFGVLADTLKQAVDASEQLQTAMVGVYDSVQGAAGQSQAMQAELINLADTSIYSTTEIAQGFQQMGVNGQDATEILNGTGAAMTILAEATQSQVVPAATLLSTTMQVLGQKAKDVSVDVQDLTFMFYNGETSITNIQGAMKAVGQQAGALHLDVNELSIALALLGEAGLKGAVGGLALKNMLIALTTPTANAQKGLSQLGIIAVNSTSPALLQLVSSLEKSGKAGKAAADAYDGSVYQLQLVFNAAHKLGLVKTDETFYAWAISAGVLKDKLFDVNGNFIGLKASIDLVGQALKGLNPEQQSALLQQIFPRTALKAAQDFFANTDQSAAAWQKLQDKLKNTSPTQDAGRAVNTLAGSSKELATTWNSALASVGQFLQGPLTQLNQVMNSLLGTFVSSPPAVKQAAAIFLVLATALTGLIFVVGAIALVVVLFGSAIAAAAPFVLGIAAALVELGAIVAVVMTHWKQITTFLHPVLLLFQQMGQFISSVFVPVFKDLGGIIQSELATQMVYLMQVVKAQLIPVWHDLQHAFVQMKPVLMVAAVIFGVIAAVIVGVIVGVIFGVIKAFVGILVGLGIAFSGVFSIISGVLMVLLGIWKIVWGTIYDIFTGHFNRIGPDILNGLLMIWSGIKAIMGGIVTTIYGLLYGLVAGVAGLIGGFVQGIIAFFTHLWNALVGHSIIPDMVKGIVMWFVNLDKQAIAIVVGFVMGMISNFLRAVGLAQSAFRVIGSAIVSVLSGLASTVIGVASNIVHGVVSGILNAGPNAVAAMLGLANSMLNAFKSIFHIASPSMVMHEMGGHLSQGLINGLQSLDVAGAASKHYGKIASATQLALHAQASAQLALPNNSKLAVAGAQAQAINAQTHVHVEVGGKEMAVAVINALTGDLKTRGAGRILR